MRSALVILVALGMALAGCTSDEDPAAPGPDADTDRDEGSMNATNTPPQILDFTANVSSGDVPFDVTFDFNASDPDGDALSWSLDVDGDGTADNNGTLLPFNYTTTYDAAGTYNATLTVSDGNNSTVATVTITATTAEPGDDGADGGNGTDGGDGAEEEPEFEDRGDYLYEFATGHCHWKEYTGEGIYVWDGTWFSAETNLVDGFQVANNHPGGASFAHPGVGDDCVDGDQLLI